MKVCVELGDSRLEGSLLWIMTDRVLRLGAFRSALSPSRATPLANTLKIASRLWHRPFGLLVDATCYNGQNEPQDDLFKKLELLTPTELSRQLSRIYIYNMNSAFR